ncbi:GFA family protein [Novosphingobium aerophilum]|uniref:GFA family protein n=1 Tax=Novosphingobium aerophilum TaxID=2839843 RepID=UPI00163DE5B8
MRFLTGGCACGAIRYRLLSTPYDTGWCHCRLCRQVSGSIGMVFTTLPTVDLVIDLGSEVIGSFASTRFGRRQFCRLCGAPLTIHVRYQPDEIDIAVGSLDQPEAVQPGFRLYVSQAPAWALANDELPRFSALRPNTRGLEPGQTEA